MTNLLTLAEAAQRLRVSVRTLEREARDGRLALVRIRSVRLVAPAELDRYIAAQEERSCQSAVSASVGKSASALAVVDALSALFPAARSTPTPGRSKLRSSARPSTLRLAASRDT
jgi:excisionase family DNA binding protein